VFILFDILKKKVSGFTSKIFGKTKDKVDADDHIISQATDVSKDNVEESKDKLKETISDKKPIFKKEEVQPDSTQKDFQQSFDTFEEPVIKKEKSLKEFDEIKDTEPVEEPSLKKKSLTKFSEDKSDLSIKKPSFEKEDSKSFDTFEEPVIKKEKSLKEFDEIKTPEIIKESVIKPKETPKQENLTIDKQKKIKTSVISSIKGIFKDKIKLSEKEISDFLEEFELSLLEADVSIDSAKAIIEDLKERLIKDSFNKKNVLEDIKNRIRESLTKQLDIDCDIDNYTKDLGKKNPFVIMFVGPNGAGKTTTIAKFGKMYKDKNLKIIFSSSDTFRAGSIQQLEKHAENLDIKVIKQTYGSDPAAVAYDAVASAKANKIDLVLIDTAGRQETNINLMQELKKIRKVVSPDLVVYIGESQAGQAIVDQVLKFKEEIGLDGVILTKLDTDPKGGVAISILNHLKLPIFFIGTGQEYDDLMKFSTKFVVDRIVE
jgi:fused signal recognition particle receptor